MTVLDLTQLQGDTFVLAEILDVFDQVNTILAGASSSFSFSVSGDSGPPQTITHSNTLHIDGGNGIATIAEATDTVRVVVDLSPEPNNSLSFDSNGKLFGRDLLGEGGGGGGSTYEPKYIITDVAHGFGTAGQIKLLGGDFSLAQANNLNTTADYVALIIDANNYYLLGAGFHQVTGHGLEIGAWYALSNDVAGGYELSYLLAPEDTRQNAFIAVDVNTIYVDLEEADPGRTVATASKITQSAHGFAVGDIVSNVGGTWVDAVAGEVCYFVKEVTDVNNFILSQVWSGSKTVTAGKTYAINPASDGNIVDVSTLDPSIDPITRVGFASKTNYLLGFCEYPLLCCGTGLVDDGEFVDTSTVLLWSESFEGGTHQNTYSDGYGFGSSDLVFINSTGRATDGDYFIRYTAASGITDFQTYFANDNFSPTKYHLKIVGDFCLINIADQSVNPIFRFMEESGGSQAGYNCSVVYQVGAGGFYARYGNNTGTPFDLNDFPSAHTVAVGKWYRVTLEAQMASAINVADGMFKWKIEELQGDEASGTDGTVVATIVPERTVSGINTHPAGTTRNGFNYVKGAGGYLSRSAPASGNWGVAYDNIKVYEVT